MSTKKSIYEKIVVQSNDGSKIVDIRQGVVSIDYYEDIFSPTITAKIVVIDTGDTIKDSKGKSSGIYNGLPLRGGERVALKIAGNSKTNPGLDFSKNPKSYLYVSGITNIISETQRETFVLNLVSRESITNETSRVFGKFKRDSSIDTSVRKILTDTLKANKIGTIEKTSNVYAFVGNSRKPFTVLTWLASKAVPASSGDATAGFVFYQTVDGFQFRSIDKLNEQSSKQTYTYTEVNKPEIDRNNDFTILKYTTNKNQNLLEKLRLGTFASFRVFYNPLTFEFTPPEKGLFKLKDYNKKVEKLGRKELKIPKELEDAPSRIITGILDVGTMEKNVSTKINADPLKHQSQSLMRYNIEFNQTLTMTVPSNTNLRAGDVIECKFPKISSDKGVDFDEDQSGLYMIKELCHHFDTDASYTSMTLIKDTNGPKKSKK